jgi:hypothetical protein
MKCNNCGGNMGLEDLKCPYCGPPNPFAEKHQEDMRRFEKEFAATKEEVVTANKKRAGRNTSLILILVLILLDVGAVIFAGISSDIAYSIKEKRIQAQADQHMENILALLEEGDYCGFSAYYSANSIYYATSGTDLEDYSAVHGAAGRYRWLLQDLEKYISGNSYSFRKESMSRTCAYMAENITKLWNVEDQYSYRQEIYLAPDKLSYIQDMRERVSLLLQTYAGLTEEEAGSLGDLSQGRIQKILEERLVSTDEE